MLQKMKYNLVGWNVDSQDWRLTEGLVDRVTGLIPPLRESRKSYIVLQHDIMGHTVRDQRDLIKALKARGFKLVNMSECLGGINLYDKY